MGRIHKYQDLGLRSMDIILCSGRPWISRKIRWFNRITGVKGPAADISHVALVYRPELGVLKVFESTTMNKWAYKSGVQTNDLWRWLQNYPGRVWVRRLLVNDELGVSNKPTRFAVRSFFRIDRFRDEVEAFINRHLGDDYESGILGLWELILCGLRIHLFSNFSGIHCSELAVLCYQSLKLARVLHCDGKIALPNNYPPHTFWEGGDFEKLLADNKIFKSARLTGPVRIK